MTGVDEGAGTAVQWRPLQAESSLSLLLLQQRSHELNRTALSCWFAGSFLLMPLLFLLMLRPLLLWLSEEKTDRGERGGGFRAAEGETRSPGETVSRDQGCGRSEWEEWAGLLLLLLLVVD